MEIKELVDIEYHGWYVDSVDDNKLILRSDYTVDNLSEIYIDLESDNYVTVSYSGRGGEGVFFHAANLTAEEISNKIVESADNYFDYE